eukprot:5897191-Prymnesium_polylepis.1
MARDVRVAVVCSESATWVLETTRADARRRGGLTPDEEELTRSADSPRLLLAWSQQERVASASGETRAERQAVWKLRRKELAMLRLDSDVGASAKRLQ